MYVGVSIDVLAARQGQCAQDSQKWLSDARNAFARTLRRSAGGAAQPRMAVLHAGQQRMGLMSRTGVASMTSIGPMRRRVPATSRTVTW